MGATNSSMEVGEGSQQGATEMSTRMLLESVQRAPLQETAPSDDELLLQKSRSDKAPPQKKSRSAADTNIEDPNSAAGLQINAHPEEPPETAVKSDSVGHRPVVDTSEAPAQKKPRIVQTEPVSASFEKGSSSRSQVVKEAMELTNKEPLQSEDLGRESSAQLQEVGNETLDVSDLPILKSEDQVTEAPILMESMPVTPLELHASDAEQFMDLMGGSAVDEALYQYQAAGSEPEFTGAILMETITRSNAPVEPEASVPSTSAPEIGKADDGLSTEMASAEDTVSESAKAAEVASGHRTRLATGTVIRPSQGRGGTTINLADRAKERAALRQGVADRATPISPGGRTRGRGRTKLRRAKPARNKATRAPPVDEFLPGNIIEIEVHNFMTYTHLKSKPGARLNLVIGPNGTGKSSLVCAIGIGLAGEPPMLGRGSSIGDYVKRGEDSGWVKITLQDQSPGSSISITRHINKQDQSEWTIERNLVLYEVSKKEVHEVVSSFNIQVNNLTQFLPQDKVTEFAKMTPVQLLEETERAVGDPELWRQHVSLINTTANMEKIERTMKQTESSLADLKSLNADVERDVQLVQERKSLLEKAENLKKKLQLSKLNQQSAEFQVALEKEKEAKQRLKEAAEKSTALKRPLEVLRRKKSDFETAIRRLEQAHDRFESQQQKSIENNSKLEELIREKTTNIAEAHNRETVRQERLALVSRKLAEAEAELAQLPNYEPPQKEIQDIGNQVEELELGMAETRNVKAEFEQILIHKRRQREQVVQRIAEIDSAKNRLLEALKHYLGAGGIVDAYKWVESHRNEFQKDVYGPVLLEINIADREHAKYVENHVAGYIWKAFVMQNANDRDYLQRNLKHLEAVIINAREPSVRNAPPLTCQMKEMGIVARLDEVVSAPPVIKHALNGQAHLDFSFIGTSQSNARADQAHALGIHDLWTPENHYRWKKSLYGKHVFTNVTAVRASRLFSQNVDARVRNELEDQKKELERKIAQVEQEVQKLTYDFNYLEDEAAALYKLREEILNKVKLERKKRLDLTSRIEHRTTRLHWLQEEEDCISAAKRIHADITKLHYERKKNVLKLADLVKEFVKNQIQLIIQKLSSTEMDVKVRELEREIRREEQLASDAQRTYTNRTNERARCHDLLQKAKRAANQQIGKRTKKLLDMFNEMPDTVEDLEDAICETMAEADAVPCNNPGVIEEYERRCEQIEELEAYLGSGRSKLQACISEIESVKGKWLPTLRTLVAEINETFGHNFQEIAVAGEVSLDEHGNDFSKYGIFIKVKFRETGELQVLSAHHQSGGERSVSTILYLVSLQDLTRCPFRVVDEINQGMDPQNERKMFQQLVRAASQLKTPQCFLLTPKLLLNLEYNEACTILNVMNGPYIQEAAERWKHGPSWATLA